MKATWIGIRIVALLMAATWLWFGCSEPMPVNAPTDEPVGVSALIREGPGNICWAPIYCAHCNNGLGEIRYVKVDCPPKKNASPSIQNPGGNKVAADSAK